MITLKRDNFKFNIYRKTKSLVIRLIDDKNKNKYNFSITENGKIYIYLDENWSQLEISDIKKTREFKDEIDKVTYELTKIIEIYSKIKFVEYQYYLIEAILYDVLLKQDLNNWLPGRGKAKYLELLDECVVGCFDNNLQEIYRAPVSETKNFDNLC